MAESTDRSEGSATPSPRVVYEWNAASRRHGLTHCYENPPPAVDTGLRTGCGFALAACRRLLLGTALDIMRPGAGANDPRMISTGAYP
jgi:hypothetical protein